MHHVILPPRLYYGSRCYTLLHISSVSTDTPQPPISSDKVEVKYTKENSTVCFKCSVADCVAIQYNTDLQNRTTLSKIRVFNVSVGVQKCFTVDDGNHSIAVFERKDNGIISETPSEVLSIAFGSDREITHPHRYTYH